MHEFVISFEHQCPVSWTL